MSAIFQINLFSLDTTVAFVPYSGYDWLTDNFNFIYVSKKYKLAEGKNPTNREHKRKNKKIRKDKLKNYLHENYLHDLKW